MADNQTSLQGSCIGSNLEAVSAATVKKLTSSTFKAEVLNADKCNTQSLVKTANNSGVYGDVGEGPVCLPHLRKAAAVWSLPAQGMSAFGENSRSEVEGEARQPGGEAMRQTILTIIIGGPPTFWAVWMTVSKGMNW